MSLDATKLGQVTAQLMESLDEQPELEDAELGEVMVLAEVKFTDEDGDRYTHIAWRCSDDREWVQRGLLHAGLDQDRVVEEPEEEA